MIRFSRARPSDAEPLARVSERAFHSDIHCGAPGLGGPPGYKSAEWQKRMMRAGQYYRITLDGQVVGGLIIFPKEPRCYELGRIFVDPDVQKKIDGVKQRLIEQYGYNEKSATDVLDFVGSIFARGDVAGDDE